MKKLRFFGLLAALVLLAFGLALSCDNGTTSGEEEPVQPYVYRYEDEANDILILFSSEPFAARATAAGSEDGDYYEIRRLSDETILLSSGQIAKVGKAITFKQEDGEVEFTAWEDTDGGLSITGIPDPENPGQTLPPIVTGPPSPGPGPGPSNYIVTFSSNGGTGTVSNKSVAPGGSITLPSGDALSKSGYDFSGWNTSPDGDEDNYDAEEEFTPSGSLTLYAKWVLEPTITYTVAAAKNVGGDASVWGTDNTTHLVLQFSESVDLTKAMISFDPPTAVELHTSVLTQGTGGISGFSGLGGKWTAQINTNYTPGPVDVIISDLTGIDESPHEVILSVSSGRTYTATTGNNASSGISEKLTIVLSAALSPGVTFTEANIDILTDIETGAGATANGGMATKGVLSQDLVADATGKTYVLPITNVSPGNVYVQITGVENVNPGKAKPNAILANPSELPAKLVITPYPAAELVAGVPTTFTLTAVDATNRQTTGYYGTKTVSITDAVTAVTPPSGITLPLDGASNAANGVGLVTVGGVTKPLVAGTPFLADVVFVGGAAEVTLTLRTAAANTLTILAVSGSITAGAIEYTVGYGPLAHVLWTNPPVAPAVPSQTTTGTANTANWKLEKSGSGDVVVSLFDQFGNAVKKSVDVVITTAAGTPATIEVKDGDKFKSDANGVATFTAVSGATPASNNKNLRLENTGPAVGGVKLIATAEVNGVIVDSLPTDGLNIPGKFAPIYTPTITANPTTGNPEEDDPVSLTAAHNFPNGVDTSNISYAWYITTADADTNGLTALSNTADGAKGVEISGDGAILTFTVGGSSDTTYYLYEGGTAKKVFCVVTNTAINYSSVKGFSTVTTTVVPKA